MHTKFKLLLLFLTISMNALSNISNNPSNWYLVTDQVMGGKSELKVEVDDGVFSLSGYVTTENNGGFVRLAHSPKNVDKEVKGIRFMAKGNNETYEVHVTMQGLRMPPWAYHSSTFDVNTEWKMFEINFSDFEKKSGVSARLLPNNIRDISFAGYGRDFDVDLQVKEISFY
jgi:NADH dehydrogenase [ubiquinone] 1 alpha subcomplex assembly factor 1